MKAYTKTIVLTVMFFVAMLFAGCEKNAEVTIKEVTSTDETFSINMDATWTVENFWMDNWISLESKNRDESVVIMQFPIRATGISGVNSLEDLRLHTENANQISDIVETEKPEIQGLKDVVAYTATMKDAITGTSAKCYFVYGETEYAYYVFGCYSSQMEDSAIEYFENMISSFKENADPEVFTANDSPDTVKWFNASAAILTKVNNWDYTIFGGMAVNSFSQATAKYLLENWWDVTDRDTAQETLEWLLERGQQAGFSEKMTYMETAGIGDVAEEDRLAFLLENFAMDEEEAENNVLWYNLYKQKGDESLKGWDYSRAMSLITYFYLAGYYTEEEALDCSLEVAGMIQTTFDSWDDYMESYFSGYEYWSGESSADRREIYENLKKEPDSPFVVDFKMELKKSW